MRLGLVDKVGMMMNEFIGKPVKECCNEGII
jgi:hypothetical protein